MKRTLLDNIIFMLQCGFVLPVMSLIEKWSSKMDQSLLRHFLLQVLDFVEPPYSYAFASSLLRLIDRPATIESLKSLKVNERKHLIVQLIEHCLQSDYPWEDGQKALLSQLSDVFIVNPA